MQILLSRIGKLKHSDLSAVLLPMLSVKYTLQIEAANQLEKQGGLDLIAVNALVAALAGGDRLLEAEKYLKKALELTASQGRLIPLVHLQTLGAE